MLGMRPLIFCRTFDSVKTYVLLVTGPTNGALSIVASVKGGKQGPKMRVCSYCVQPLRTFCCRRRTVEKVRREAMDMPNSPRMTPGEMWLF